MNIFAIVVSLVFGLGLGYLWGDQQNSSELQKLEKSVKSATEEQKDQTETIDELRKQIAELESSDNKITAENKPHKSEKNKNTCPSVSTQVVYKNAEPKAKNFEESQRQLVALQEKFQHLGEVCLTTQVPKETLRKLGVSVETVSIEK